MKIYRRKRIIKHCKGTKDLIDIQDIADLNGKHHPSLLHKMSYKWLPQVIMGISFCLDLSFSVLFLDIITTTVFSMALYLCIPLESVKYTGTKFLSQTRNRVTRIITANIRFMIIIFVLNKVKLIAKYWKFSSN